MKSLRGCLAVCVTAALIAVLSACTRAPTEDELKADVQTLVDAGLTPGLLDVVSARRANDFPFVVPGDPVKVRYGAVLRLKRDHRFGAWDQVNVGVVSLLLGAPPQDIQGIKPAGNAAGDTLTVKGRIVYDATDTGLKLQAAPPAPPPDGAGDGVLLSELAAAMNEEWNALKGAARMSTPGLMLDEAGRARRAVAGRAARESGGFSVATDTAGTEYWRVGRAAEQAAAQDHVPFANVAAEGPQEALDFLRDGRVSAAVLRNTEAGLATAGVAPYAASGPYKLAALAALYPMPVHIIVKADSPLGSPSELFGKHVGVAGTARVDAVEAEAILRGHGVPLAALAAPLMAVPPAEALDQLNAGAFDALVMTAPLPSAALRDVAGRRPVRLLPFDSDAIAFLTSGVANYVAITIPARIYPGQDRPLAAVAAVAMLVSVETVPTKEAASLLGFMLTRTDYLRFGSLPGAMIARDAAQRPMTLPWHPGAAAFFEISDKE